MPKYIRTPLPLSAVERMQQERAGIPLGTTCAVSMVKGTPIRRGGRRIGTKRDGGTPIGRCPRYATMLCNGEPRCEAHRH